MKINIQAPWDVNDYLRNIIDEKIEKLYTIDNRIVHADIFLKKGGHSGIEDKLVEIRLRVPGPEIFAQTYSDTYEKAVVATVEKLRKQMIKKKELLEEKKKRMIR